MTAMTFDGPEPILPQTGASPGLFGETNPTFRRLQERKRGNSAKTYLIPAVIILAGAGAFIASEMASPSHRTEAPAAAPAPMAVTPPATLTTATPPVEPVAAAPASVSYATPTAPVAATPAPRRVAVQSAPAPRATPRVAPTPEPALTGGASTAPAPAPMLSIPPAAPAAPAASAPPVLDLPPAGGAAVN